MFASRKVLLGMVLVNLAPLNEVYILIVEAMLPPCKFFILDILRTELYKKVCEFGVNQGLERCYILTHPVLINRGLV